MIRYTRLASWAWGADHLTHVADVQAAVGPENWTGGGEKLSWPLPLAADSGEVLPRGIEDEHTRFLEIGKVDPPLGVYGQAADLTNEKGVGGAGFCDSGGAHRTDGVPGWTRTEEQGEDDWELDLGASWLRDVQFDQGFSTVSV